MRRVPFNLLPMTINRAAQTYVSLQRINQFMNADELQPGTVTHDEAVKEHVLVEDATFSWDDSAKPTLKNISLKVKPGELVAVVGAVGTGKSSLLSALLGEMNLVSGSVNTKGTVAYVPQQAWMQNATLSYNITFGKRFKRSLYDKVIEACALTKDLDILPGGDQTEIGEKGINLSGGQKQRISMARYVLTIERLSLLVVCDMYQHFYAYL